MMLDYIRRLGFFQHDEYLSRKFDALNENYPSFISLYVRVFQFYNGKAPYGTAYSEFFIYFRMAQHQASK